MLVPGGVAGPVGEQDELALHVRVRGLHAVAQRRAQPLGRGLVSRVGRHRRLDRLRRRQAVRAARRGADVVLEHLEATVAVAHDVEARDRDARAADRLEPTQVVLQVDGALDDASGDDPVGDRSARAVHVGDERVERQHPLAQARRQLLPLLGGQQARHRVDDELRAVPLAAEPDAPLAQPRLDGLGGVLHSGLGERFQDLQVVLAHDTRSLERLVETVARVVVLGAGRQCRHRGHLPSLAFGDDRNEVALLEPRPAGHGHPLTVPAAGEVTVDSIFIASSTASG